VDPEEGGGGGLASSKFMGMPVIVWVGGIALIVYFLFFRNSGAGRSGSGTGQAGNPVGGSGTITSGDTTIDSGAVQVTVNGANSSPGAGISAANTAQQVAESGTGSISSQQQPAPPASTTTTTTSSGDLPAPGGFTVKPSGNTVALAWAPVSGAQMYHYQVLQGSRVVASSLTGNTSVTVPNLRKGQRYQTRVSVGQPRGLWTGEQTFTAA